MTWRPISETPPDDIILMANYADIDGEIVRLWVASGFYHMSDLDGPFIDVIDEYIKPIGWQAVTHWMPMPTDP